MQLCGSVVSEWCSRRSDCSPPDVRARSRTTPAPPATRSDGAFVQELKDKGELVAGVKFDVPQFGLKSVTTDEVEGFDADMAREVAKELDVDVKFVEALSANRIPYLQEDKVDIVFSTMTITDERKKQIDFSDVYYVAEQSFLTRKGTDMTVETAAGKKVCTAKGSTSELNLPALQPDVEMELQDGYAQCVQLLRNDQVDAVSTDDVILLQFLKKDPGRVPALRGEVLDRAVRRRHQEGTQRLRRARERRDRGHEVGRTLGRRSTRSGSRP